MHLQETCVYSKSVLLKLGADCQSALPWSCPTEWSRDSTAGTAWLLTLLISLTIENPKFYIVFVVRKG